ncbi:MAG: hypothetical protein KDH96_04650 [Candidatus Riesia sp.]|nr:hypothetical protein [Candidatus Riesia sp.]
MAKLINGFKTLVKKLSWVDALTSGITNEEKVIRNRILPELQELVSAFDTNIPITYERDDSGDSVKFNIGPPDNVYFTRDSDGASIPVASLFQWLNEGTDVRHAVFYGDYQRESFPNSLRTQSQDNSDVKIYVSKEFNFPGIEARNWTILLRNKYESEIERSFLSGIKRFLSGK